MFNGHKWFYPDDLQKESLSFRVGVKLTFCVVRYLRQLQQPRSPLYKVSSDVDEGHGAGDIHEVPIFMTLGHRNEALYNQKRRSRAANYII